MMITKGGAGMETSIISALFTALTEIIEKVGSAFGDVITSATALFWDSTNGLTLIGTLGLISLGFGLFKFGFSFVMRLVRMRG